MLVSTIGIIKITLILVILLNTMVKSGNVDDNSLVFAIRNVDPEISINWNRLPSIEICHHVDNDVNHIHSYN